MKLQTQSNTQAGFKKLINDSETADVNQSLELIRMDKAVRYSQ
jgi:hypothetical protein